MTCPGPTPWNPISLSGKWVLEKRDLALSVAVPLGCSHRRPETGGCEQQTWVSHCLEAAVQEQGPGRPGVGCGPLAGSRCVLTWWTRREPCALGCQGTDPTLCPTVTTSSPPRGLPPHSVTLGVTCQHEFWGTETFRGQQHPCFSHSFVASRPSPSLEPRDGWVDPMGVLVLDTKSAR